MTKRQQDSEVKVGPASVNSGYAAFQIAKALTTSKEHDDPAIREQAKEKISKWETVLRNILTGGIEYGSRKPIEGIPEWVTLEVVTGGFATGELLASGPLREHEKKILKNFGGIPEGAERRTLNAHFLTDAGLAELQDRLQAGRYDVSVPEEGALLVVTWLVENGYAEDARELLDKISPYFSRLRFYPIPREHPQRFSSRVHLQDVGKTLEDLRRIRPNKRLQAQKQAVEIWLPFYDRIVAVFLETVENGWPCQHYPVGWSERALSLLDEYAELKKECIASGKLERASGHSAQLREFLGRCAQNPGALTGREVGRIRLILNCYVEKRGTPDSPTCTEARRRQAADVSAPTFHEIAGVVVSRLEKCSKDDGLDDVSHLKADVTIEEAKSSSVPEGILIPPSIQRKIERCLNESVDVLVERGLITSGEMLAKVLPQMTSGLRAAGIIDPALRQLYAAIYRAFRRRRSLLLFNLEKQVQIEELPWIAAIDRFRSESLSSRDLAGQTLEELTTLTLTSFPHAILPNKLLQELRALATGAELDIPLVDELAADIFMGKFSEKFVESAWRAADLLHGSLYATYYGIDYEKVRNIPKPKGVTKRRWPWQTTKPIPDKFAQLCASRVGVSLGMWNPAINGMIIEQQQIITTQNLAALFVDLDLANALHGQLGEMAKHCFRWICKRHQMKIDKWHAHLILLKNTAYAWRQMVFFLTLLTDRDVTDFLRWAEEHLNAQAEDFRIRFRPVLNGLILAANGRSIESNSSRELDARRFLGWSDSKHWLLTNAQDKERNS